MIRDGGFDMEDNMLDIMERMENLVPEYSYSNVKDIVKTDSQVRGYLLDEIKGIKDSLFHVVQISYELQKDKLSDAAEGAWDDMDSLVDRIENSKTSKMKGDKHFCEECKNRIEVEIGSMVRKDRELIMEVSDLKRTVHLLYRALLDQGREGHFIKNLSKVKKYIDSINSLLEAREMIVTGGNR